MKRISRKQALRRGRYARQNSSESLEVRALLSGSGNQLGYVQGELLVQYKAGVNALERFQTTSGWGCSTQESIHTQAMKDLGQGVMERVQLAPGLSLQSAQSLLVSDPNVLYAEPNYIVHTTAVSNDTEYVAGELWGMYGSDSPVTAGPAGTTNEFGSNAEAAWLEDVTGSHDVIVGVIDDGVNIAHEDLADNIWVNPFEIAGDGVDNDGNGFVDDVHGWNFLNDTNNVYSSGDDHGTHVAGTIGATGNNETGVAGVNWQVSMIAAKFLGSNGGRTSDAIRAIDYMTDLKVRHGINLVATNNSWGGGNFSQALKDAILRSAKADILFVAAAGNNGLPMDSLPFYPAAYTTLVGTDTESAADYEAVVSVAAINSNGNLASFSNFGEVGVDLAAPGVGIRSTVGFSDYEDFSGTSMASPHVTGAIALYASVMTGGTSAADIRGRLLDSVVSTPSLSGNTSTGGRLDVRQMLGELQSLRLDRGTYGPEAQVTIELRNQDLNLDSDQVETVNVTVISTTEATPLTVQLTETGADTGLFTGSVQLTEGTATADDLLQVSDGDTLTVNWAAGNLTKTATVDGSGPVLSQISADPGMTDANVSWLSDEPADSLVRYGLTESSLTQSITASVLTTNHQLKIAGLTNDTVYYYQVESKDEAGNVTTSAVSSFVTDAAASILLVDDDQGVGLEVYFTNALDANGHGYDVWDVSAAGATPEGADLTAYEIVIWNTGFNYTATDAGLSSGEQTAIAQYLDDGGRLFLSGQDVLYNGVSSSFRRDYLHVDSYSSDTRTFDHIQLGTTGNEISDGMTLSISSPAGAGSLWIDTLVPDSNAAGLLTMGSNPDSGPYSAVNYRGDFAAGGFGVVFTTTPFESMGDNGDRDAFMQRTIEYLTSTTEPQIGISVSSPSPSSRTTEPGGQVTFAVKLTSQPTADVVIPVSSSNEDEGFASVSSLIFTPANWSTPQSVVVTGTDDSIDDGDQSYVVVLGSAASDDADYDGLDADDVALTNTDDDTAGITVSDAGSGTTTETGGQVSFTVRLDSEPLDSVIIDLSSSDLSEGVVSVTSLTFDAANWDVPQTVTVTGQDDDVDDGDVSYSVVTSAASSGDPLYSGLNANDVALQNLDDDTAGITVSTPSGTETAETGTAITFSVVLDSEPTGSVIIPLTSTDTTEGVVSPASLTFTAADWSTAQTVTVTGQDDLMADGDISYSLQIGAATSTDAVYSGINPADIDLVNTDDEEAGGITVSNPSSSVTSEDGDSVTFTVVLVSSPATGTSVQIPVSSNDSTEGTTDVTEVVFDSTNWSTPQTVTVTGVDDSAVDGDVAYTIVIGVSVSGDPRYNGLNEDDLQLVNEDNDVPPPSTGTKFYVVDEFFDRTYEYESDGTPVEDNSLRSDNFNPRGVATTVAGDRVWVIDANRRVYVYDNSGGLLGSWLALGLPNRALVQGITTDGTDIWLVENRRDRVYQYSGAASRLSGEVSRTRRWDLQGGNSRPRGIVYGETFGQPTLYVVDDGSGNDLVFVYPLFGNNPGEGSAWALDTENSRPRGIALDPSNASMDIWVVDTSLNRVYRYANARTSVQPEMVEFFNLASSNRAPAGISDPPPSSLVAPASVIVNQRSVSSIATRAELPDLDQMLRYELATPLTTIAQATQDHSETVPPEHTSEETPKWSEFVHGQAMTQVADESADIDELVDESVEAEIPAEFWDGVLSEELLEELLLQK